MTQWRSNGRPLSQEQVAALGLSDGEVLCDYDGVAFRFTAESVRPREAERGLHGETTTVLTLVRLDGAGRATAACLVDFAPPTGLAAEGPDRLLDAADAIGSRAARRHVATELFRRAEEQVTGERAA
jgi:hypothetical protein